MRQESKPISSSIPTLYQKALESFILKKYQLAWSTCNTALRLLYTSESTPQPLLRTRLWLLKINLARSLSAEDSSQTFIESEGQKFELNTKLSGEKLVRFLWRDVVNESKGTEDVDGEIVVACILLAITRQAPEVAREIAESWLFTLSDETRAQFEMAAAAQTEQDITTASPSTQTLAVYIRVVELYLLHVLAELKDFVYAREFLDSNSYLSSDFKEKCTETLRELEIKSKEKAASSVSKLFSQKFLMNGTSTHVAESAETKGNKDLLAESKKEPSGSTSSGRHANIKNGGESNRFSTSPSPKHVESRLARSPSSTFNHTEVQSPAQRTAVLIRRLSDIFLQIFQKASRTQLFVIAFVFTVLGFATRQREKIWVLLKLLSVKTLQTVKMATRITYM